MIKFILLTVLFVVGCIAAPAQDSQQQHNPPSLPSRPTPINPDIPSDPKPQDKITLINNDEHKLKQKRDNEPKRPIPQTLPGPIQIPSSSSTHTLHKRQEPSTPAVAARGSTQPTAKPETITNHGSLQPVVSNDKPSTSAVNFGSTQPTAKPGTFSSDTNRRPYQPVSSGRLQKREDQKPKPQTLPKIPDNSQPKKSADTTSHKNSKRDIPVPVREESSTSTTKRPEITEPQPHPATVVRPVPVSQIFGKKQQQEEEDKSQQTPSTDDIKSPAQLS